MRATMLLREKVIYAPDAFAELVLWQVPVPVPGSMHRYKYRLAYVVRGVCVVRFDNERPKGDHRHFGDRETAYSFVDVDKLVADFQRDIVRWNRENGRS